VNLYQLELFVVVARTGTFTSAAKALHLSQPAISSRIHDLEASLGEQLFEQIGRRIFLTDAGNELLPRAEAILSQVAEAKRAVAEVNGLARGSLRVVATTTVGTYVVPRVLGDFHRAYPGIVLTLDVTNWTRAVESIRAQRMDLAVLGGQTVAMDDMIVQPFMRNELVAVAAPTHPLAQRIRIPLAELATYPMLLREEGSGSRTDAMRIFSEQGLRPHAIMELRHSAAIKQGVAAGLGFAVLSRQAILLQISQGILVTLDVEGLPLHRDWHIVHLKERRLPRAVAAFKEMLIRAPTEVQPYA
jgi:DNA-binding transcriptional LysR family regulator